jgi:RHS repeat-associated protein
MLASSPRFAVVVEALGACSRYMRRSGGQLARKALAIVLVEIIAVTSSVSLVSGPVLPVASKYGTSLSGKLAFLLAEEAGTPWLNENLSSKVIPPIASRSPLSLSSALSKSAASASPAIVPKAVARGISSPGTARSMVGGAFFQAGTTPPGISGLQPNAASPGTAITITGAHFGSVQASGAVTFNGAAAGISSWSDSAIVATVPSGATTGSVVVTTGTGLVSGSPLFTVLNPGLSIDQVVSAQGNTNAGSVATATFSTNSANEVLVAFIASAQNQTGGVSSISSVTGGGLSWVLAERSNASGGTAEIWRAFAPTALNNVSVTAVPANPNVSSDVVLTVASFIGADTTGTNGSGAIGAVVQASAPSAALTTTRNNSLVFAVGADAKNPATVTAGINQNILNILTNQVNGTCVPTAVCTPVPGDMLWVQQVDTAIVASGTTVSLSDTTSPSDVIDFSVVEILPAATPGTAPLITSLSSISGAPGSVITISGANFGAVQGTSAVTFNGIAATPTSWSANSIVVPVPATATTGNVVVNTGQASNALRFVLTNSAGLGIDQNVSSDVPADSINVSTTPTFSTTSGNQLLLAFISASALSTPVTVSSVTGGGLTWTLVKRTNNQAGTAEIWRAFSPFILSNVAMTANLVNNSETSVTVLTYLGVDTTGTNGSGAIGALGTAASGGGAPSATLVSTQKNSMVFGVGIDPTNGLARTPATGQSLVHQVTNVCVNHPPQICLNGANNTSWVQQVNASVATVGTSVKINDTAPTSDPFNLTIVEVRPPAVSAPTITSLSPTSGPIGTSVTIAGSNFGSSQGPSTVTFGGVLGTPGSWTASAIVVPVPSGVPPGAASVVVNVTGAGPSNSLSFTVIAPLAITSSISPAKNAAGWNNTNVTISYQCTGGVAPVQCPASQTVTTEGVQSITATATDASGAQASVPTPLKIDKTPPVISITSPANDSSVASSALQVSGTVSDALSGVSVVTCNNAAATVSAGTYNCSVTLAPGRNTINVVATDVALNITTQSVTVTLGPTITDFTPKAGPTGTAVSILGTNLSIPPNATTVTFAGPTGPLTAKVNFANSTQLAVVVPDTAITGPITINTSVGAAITASPFTIGPRQDFSVTLLPSTGTATQSSNTSFAIAISSPQATFTQLASLSVSGLPSGVASAFSPQQITAGASAGLTVDLSATNLAPGSYPFVVHAVATIDGKVQERTAAGTLTVIAAGQTTLSGQVLSSANQPIIGASVSIDGVTVLTDGAGRFFMTGIQSGTNRSLSVDGHSATSPNATFPLIFEPVNIIAGRANNVATPFHLPPIDTSQEVTIDPTRDTVAGNVSVTNLQMTIPVGAHLRMLDGTLVTRTSITPLAPDRTPAPLPSDVGTNIVYTAQPGGAITDIAIPVIYPNLAGLDPGTRVELYAFDHAHVNWFVYGFGRVSTDGRTIAPEIDPTTGKPYGLKDFSWSFPNTGPNGNPSDPNACPKSRGPHPVDYSTGMKIERVPQVSWGGARGAFKFELIYTTDKVINCNNCPFGRGWTHNWDIKLSGTFSAGGAGRLILPDQVSGNLLNSSGTDASGSPRFTMSSTPSALGSQLIRGSSITQYRDPDGTTLNFDSSGRLLSKVDANGNTTTLQYTNGLLTKITDPVGRFITLAYDAIGRVSSMTDPLNQVWHYTYEGTPGVTAAPGLTTITDPKGGVTRYSYINPGRIVSVTDPRGNVVKQITYDANGRVASQTFADGGTETYSYQLSGTIVTSSTVTSPTGTTQTRRFNASGYVIGITDASGQTATIQRDLNTNVAVSVVGSCGCNQTQRTYSTTGDVTNSSNATGGLWLRNYEPNFHMVAKVTDPLNNPTTYTYDQKGNLLTKLDALKQTTTYGYDAFGELHTVQTPAGGVSTINYDTQGNISNTVDPSGKITNFEYDGLGHIVAVVDPLQRRSTMQYDELYRLVSTTDPALNTTTYEYDANGNRTAIVNALLKRWVYAYDARNRLVSRTDPLLHKRSYTYDAAGRLLSSKTPLGRITSYTYTPRGQIASKIAPNGDTTKFEYDSSGNATKVTDARGNTISYSYDASNRLTSRTDPLGRVSTITYDVAGNVTSRSDRFGRQTTYTYDVLNRPIQVNYSDATVNITYDPDGRIAEKDDSTGGSIQWAYDTNGRPTSETTAGGIVDYSYNDAGQPISAGVRGRVPTQYGYDSFGRLNSIGFGTKSFSFQYDAASRRTAVTRPNGITSTYTYDDANRLTHISHTNAGGVALEDLAYAIDDDGRLTSSQSAVNHTLLPASATSGTFDANNRPTQFNGNALSFDDLGELVSNMVGQTSTTYQWDGRGRLTGAHLPNGKVVQYSYDAMNRLASRSVNGASTSYLYSGGEVLLRSDSLGNQTDFVDGASQTERLLQTGSSGDLYFLQDRLANVVSLTSSSGAVVEQESYEPFGNTTGSAATEYGYIGERFDADSHLMVLNARFYDPVQQRFITEDPIGTVGGMNVFAYSENDPVNAADPSGLYWCGADFLPCAANISAGAGDKLSFGFTNWVRDKMGTNDVVDKCGLGYQVGGYVGDAVNYSIMALSLVGPLAEAGAAAAEAVEGVEAVEAEAGLAGDAETVAEEASSEAQEIASACGKCFAAGTGVLTSKGSVAIENVKVGDEVLSRNMKSGKLEYKKVVRLTAPHQDQLLELRVEGQANPLLPTSSHPFYVRQGSGDQGKWVNASSLRVGDALLTKDGKWTKLVQISSLQRRETVYNFEVEENHDYFVGKKGILVHNAGPCFVSTDPLVADVANEIEALYPGHVVGVNVDLLDAGGSVIGDADILLQNAVIQVKSGANAGGLLSQLEVSAEATGLPSIGYAPNMLPNALRAVTQQGGLVTNVLQVLIDVIRP